MKIETLNEILYVLIAILFLITSIKYKNAKQEVYLLEKNNLKLKQYILDILNDFPDDNLFKIYNTEQIKENI